MLNPLAGLSERGWAGTSPATSRREGPMVFAKEQRTDEDVLVDRLTERPAARSARIRRKTVDPELKRAIARLLAEKLLAGRLAYRTRAWPSTRLREGQHALRC
jgi:hypothetical protein